MTKGYAKLLAAIASAPTEVAEDAALKLVAHLKATGRAKLLPSVLEGLKRAYARRRLLAPVVEVASEKEKSAALSSAKELGIEADEARINPSLVSGWRASANGALVDRSGKRALIDIYKKVTS